MNSSDINKLREFCTEFSGYRAYTEDGDGTSLHDIKNSFDYVEKTLSDNGLTETAIGADLAQKAHDASGVLSDLWLCLQNLEKSIGAFCDQQENNNNQI